VNGDLDAISSMDSPVRCRCSRYEIFGKYSRCSSKFHDVLESVVSHWVDSRSSHCLTQRETIKSRVNYSKIIWNRKFYSREHRAYLSLAVVWLLTDGAQRLAGRILAAIAMKEFS